MQKTGQILFTLVILALLAGCSALDLPQRAPVPEEDDVEDTSKEKTEECDWLEVRGVAELISVDNGEGTFMFYPGDTLVTKELDQIEWFPEVADESKATLKEPADDSCGGPKIILVSPLTSSDSN